MPNTPQIWSTDKIMGIGVTSSFVICHLGIFAHQDIERVFVVGYTSINGALKRAQVYLESDKKMKKKVESILNDK